MRAALATSRAEPPPIPTTASRPPSRTRAASSSASAKVGSPGPLTNRSSRTPASSAAASAADDVRVAGDGLLDHDQRPRRPECPKRVGQLRDDAVAERDPDRKLGVGRRDGVGHVVAGLGRRSAPRGTGAPRRRAPRRAACPPPSPGARGRRRRSACPGPRGPRASRPRPTRSRRAPPHAPDALMVARLDAVVALTEDRGEARAALDVDRVLGEGAEHLAVALVADGLWEVLDEIAAAEDVEELEAAADRERRDVALERPGEERELAGVAMRLGRVGRGVTLGAVVRPGRCRCRPRRRRRRGRRASRRPRPCSAG